MCVPPRHLFWDCTHPITRDFPESLGSTRDCWQPLRALESYIVFHIELRASWAILDSILGWLWIKSDSSIDVDQLPKTMKKRCSTVLPSMKQNRTTLHFEITNMTNNIDSNLQGGLKMDLRFCDSSKYLMKISLWASRCSKMLQDHLQLPPSSRARAPRQTQNYLAIG